MDNTVTDTRIIGKYILDPGRTCEGRRATLLVDMKRGAKILCAMDRPEGICIWAEIDVNEKNVPRAIVVTGTGWVLNDDLTPNARYVSSVVTDGGPVLGELIFHIYDLGEDIDASNQAHH